MDERRSTDSEPNGEVTRDEVRSFYSNAAVSVQESLCCPAEYNPDQLSHIPKEALEVSYGCGSPMDRANIQFGETVVDLGSGGGIDCFIAAKMTGAEGKVYGIDMTEKMLGVARRNTEKVAQNLGYQNVEFLKGFLEEVPLDDNSADLVTSNCVINLSTDKSAVFGEIYRILKPGGRFMIADIVSDKPVTQDMKQNKELWGECISGAQTLEEFLATAQKCEFVGLTIRKDYLWKIVNKIKFYSFTMEGFKFSSPQKSSCKSLTAIYAGPFLSVSCGGETYRAGIPKKIDQNTAEFLSSGSFVDHFNILEPDESIAETSDSSCCD